MSESYLENLPENFPLTLLTMGQKPLGVSALAWPYPEILKVIEVLAEAGKVILGGDVYRRSDQGLVLTYDNWTAKKREGASWSEQVSEAARHAITYIDAFHMANGNEFWYSVVVA